MDKKPGLIAAALLMLVVSAAGQSNDAPDLTGDIGDVRQLRTKAENSPALSDDLKAGILELYDGALVALESAADNQTAASRLERDRSGVDRMVEVLRKDLARPEREPILDLPTDPTFEQAEDALARERSRLAANRSALRDAEHQAEERTKTRTDIARRLGALDQDLEQLNDELRTEVERYTDADLKLAARTNVLAHRHEARTEIDELRASLALIEERGALIPLEIDHAQRRVAFSEEMVVLYIQAAHELRQRDGEESLGRIRQMNEAASTQVPELAAVAAETGRYAEMLWGPDGVIVKNERTIAALLATRKHLSDLDRISELTRRKFEAYGQRGSVTRWWPDIPDDFPKNEAVASTVRRLDREIPEVEHRLITLEQRRSKSHEYNRATRLELQAVYGEEPDPEVKRLTRELLALRRDLLDELIQEHERHASQLVEYRTVSRHFLTNLAKVERFLFSHVLWARSVPLPIVPRPSDMAAAAGWLINEGSVLFADAGLPEGGPRVLPRDGLVIVLVLLVFLLYPKIHRRLAELADRVEDPSRDRFRHTVEATVLTAFLAAPIPVLLYLGASILGRAEGALPLLSTARTFTMLAMVAGLLASIRQLFVPRGLAEAHFNWPPRVTRLLHRGLLIPELVALPMLFVAIKLGFAGIRLDSPLQLQIYNNSLGRVAFIIALLVIGFAAIGLLRPEKKSDVTDEDRPLLWSRLFSKYAFPTAFLVALPLLILATIIPAVLAALGYYLTALLLAYEMLRTLLLGFIVLVGGGLVHRWRVASARRAVRDAGEEALDPQYLREVAAAEIQTRQLFRFIAISVLAVGLFSIWSDALPMLQIMKRVQVWPKIAVMEPEKTGQIKALAVAGKTNEETPATTAGSDSVDTPSVPGVPAIPSDQPSAQQAVVESESPLTLWSLLEAILAGIIAVILAKNLPGLLELFFTRRTTVDAGARVAFATLVRYTITILGATMVFGILGVTWSKIQWLAAALTFGLGFGLQEIVANFVSGLILLVERPVRVGDVVTIGNLMGTVTKIQIRATTITLWDRSEMIVPNKEFITTKLVNWTLSDSKRRIEIPVRIVYGTDLGLVKKIMVDIANEHPAVLEDPAPNALLLEFGEDAVQLELRFVVDFGKGLATKDEVQMGIDKVFRETGIDFALPQRRIHVVTEAGAQSDTREVEPDGEGDSEDLGS